MTIVLLNMAPGAVTSWEPQPVFSGLPSFRCLNDRPDPATAFCFCINNAYVWRIRCQGQWFDGGFRPLPEDDKLDLAAMFFKDYTHADT